MAEERAQIARMRNLVQSSQNEAASNAVASVRAEATRASQELQSIVSRATSGGGYAKVSGSPSLPEFRNYFIWGKSTWGVDNTTSSPSGSATLMDRGTLSSGDRGGVYRSIGSSGG